MSINEGKVYTGGYSLDGVKRFDPIGISMPLKCPVCGNVSVCHLETGMIEYPEPEGNKLYLECGNEHNFHALLSIELLTKITVVDIKEGVW